MQQTFLQRPNPEPSYMMGRSNEFFLSLFANRGDVGVALGRGSNIIQCLKITTVNPCISRTFMSCFLVGRGGGVLAAALFPVFPIPPPSPPPPRLNTGFWAGGGGGQGPNGGRPCRSNLTLGPQVWENARGRTGLVGEGISTCS